MLAFVRFPEPLLYPVTRSLESLVKCLPSGILEERTKASMVQLTDSYSRKMDYLSISVTDRCNFRCQYCMPEDIQFQDKSHILTLEEMLTFAEACLELGVTKVRVTGGEPLVRRGVVMFIGWLKDLGFEDVTMTTNGFLLEENLDGLIEAGLDRVNISLDTLQPEKFAFITRRNHFEKVWSVMGGVWRRRSRRRPHFLEVIAARDELKLLRLEGVEGDVDAVETGFD